MKQFYFLLHQHLRTSLVIILMLGMTVIQAQTVNLNDTGWQIVGETYENINNGSGTDRFYLAQKLDSAGNRIDLLFYWELGTPSLQFTGPPGNLHNLAYVGNEFDVIPPGATTTSPTIRGQRIAILPASHPDAAAPFDLCRILFRYTGVDANQFIFSNKHLGEGGDPSAIPAVWVNAFGFHTDEEGDETGSITNQSSVPVHWRPNTTIATTPVALTAPITSSADTDSSGQLAESELKSHLAGLGYTSVHNIFATTQSFSDYLTSNNMSTTGINTTPLAPSDIVPTDASGNFSVYVTLEDTAGLAISSLYGAWVTGTLDSSLSVDDASWDRPRLTLYPNPTSDYFSVEMDGQTMAGATITVYDMGGRQVAQPRRSSGFAFEERQYVGHLPAGVYVVRVIQNEQTTSLKLVKH